MSRESGTSWVDATPSTSGTSWGGGESWGESSPPNEPLAARAEAGWGSAPSSNSWESEGQHPTSPTNGNGGAWGSEAAPPSAPSLSAPPASPKNNGGWLGGDTEDDWAGGGLATSAPVTSNPKPSLPQNNGWLSDGPSSGGNSSTADSYSDGWQTGGSEPATAGRGWLVDSAADSPRAESGSGWLADGGGTGGPSMTEMVDQAIHNEVDDDFVDDSWVDEEIRDSEFDELEVPEIAYQSPEAGGTILKMVLVAFLALLVLGGVFFFRGSSTPTEEERIAAEIAQKSEFAQKAIEGGKSDMAEGRALLAIPQFQEALVTLSDLKADIKEIEATEVLLGQAMMKAEEHEAAVAHWRKLKSSQNPAVAKEALDGIKESNKEIRKDANEMLKEAKQLVAKGEVNTVLPRARDALKLYKEYGGTNAQQGDAHGVLGRSYLNGRDYGNAQDNLRIAVRLAPGAGYERYLADVNSRLQTNYYNNSAPVHVPQPRTQSPSSRPSFDIGGPSYQTRTGSSGGGRRSTGGGSSSAAESRQQEAPRVMKEIPIHKGSTSRPSSGGPRKGQRDVLTTY